MKAPLCNESAHRALLAFSGHTIQLWVFFFSFFLSLPFIADRSFSNVNGRASEEDIEDLEDLVKILMANLTSFETTIIG